MANQAIRTIIREVIAECADSARVIVSEQLAAFMIKATVLNPANQFSTESELSAEDVDKLVELCVHQLTDDTSITTATIRMQTAFGENLRSFDDAVHEHSVQRHERVKDVYAGILNSFSGTRAECELLQRKIVSFLLLRSDLGSPTDTEVVRETAAALESVLPLGELNAFGVLAEDRKTEKLQDLAEVVTGIRIFNKDCGKGGNSIPDYAHTLPSSANTILSTTKEIAVDELRSAIQYSLDMKDESLLRAQANAQQAAVYSLQLNNTLQDIIRTKLHPILSERTELLNGLREVVQSRTAVPTDVVYPYFKALAVNMDKLQAGSMFLSHLEEMISVIRQHKEVQSPVPKPTSNDHAALNPPSYIALVHHLTHTTSECLTLLGVQQHDMAIVGGGDGPNDKKSQPALIPKEDVEMAQGAHGTVDLLVPGVTQGFDSMQLDNGGLCLVSAVASPPVLKLADRTIGLLKYNQRLYGFADVDCAKKFLGDIDGTFKNLLDAVKVYPELMELLDLHDAFASDNEAAKRPFQPKTAPIMTNCGMQTELHPVESNIVKNYESNEWALRRQAIQLANLRKKKTHSVQTHDSNFRRDSATQLYLPKENGTQTRTDAGTNVPKPTTYVKHLRGPRGPKARPAEVVDLTLGIGGVQLEVRSLTGSRGSNR